MNDTELHALLVGALSPALQAPALHVAFSGGLDSTVLLHLLVEQRSRRSLPPLHAIHVHHGLQPAADAWPEHCRAFCAALGVPLHVEYVTVHPQASLEQAARQARYAAFARLIGEGDCLLSAQHRDDQAETLLFRLLRGAGVRGLSAMSASRALGGGQLLRPLLGVARADLEGYAQRHGLNWVEDPSNQDLRHARNFLRGQVMPVLRSRWPQASASLARSAAHLSEAQQLLDELASADLAAAARTDAFPWLSVPALALAPLAALSPARQRNALRHWLAAFSRLPDTDHWAGWEALRDAGPEAHPVWALADGQLHRAAGQLWWLSGDWLRPSAASVAGQSVDWPNPGQPLKLSGNGLLSFIGPAPVGAFEVRYRQGGECLEVPGRGRRDLKRLFNERGVPGFVRNRVPLLFQGGQLLAVANIHGLDGLGVGGGRLRWQPPAGDQCL
ncbi:tRNA lysidine(34) synthetase TilS [uncultured Pseudomonas sp.]|uniref:tRNA lysidine(34) synthetase TilS n=1 Tax=uncultured Pseudomonas sp. TaxID=114707 RepID=UPI0025EA035F|nr:tRNA lysidine(34) synthetase TilS [uncultured Pseudomonas sp.]